MNLSRHQGTLPCVLDQSAARVPQPLLPAEHRPVAKARRPRLQLRQVPQAPGDPVRLTRVQSGEDGGVKAGYLRGLVDLRAGCNMMKLTSIACREFERQIAREQRRLLELLVNRAMGKEGRLEVTLHEPFRTLARSNSASATKDGAKRTSESKLSNWLPGMDSNLHPSA